MIEQKKAGIFTLVENALHMTLLMSCDGTHVGIIAVQEWSTCFVWVSVSIIPLDMRSLKVIRNVCVDESVREW